MPGRNFNSNSYRYGFNGKEKDDEVQGAGNEYDFGARIYDPRLGRFLSTDPRFKEYPELTPYQFASNRPIDGIDLDGLEHVSYLISIQLDGKPKTLSVFNYSTDGKLGHGIEVQTILKNGEVVTSFLPTNAAPSPAKSIAEKTGDAFVAGLQKMETLQVKAMGNTYGEMEGEKGMGEAAELLDNVGAGMKATVILAPIGEGFSVMSDGMNTMLDYKNKDIATATKNTAVRLLTFGTGKVLDKAVDGVKNVSKVTKEAVKITNDVILSKSKDAATK